MPVNEVNRKIEIIENICMDIIGELKKQNIVDKHLKSDFLSDYGPYVQHKIKDEKLRNWSPWLD